MLRAAPQLLSSSSPAPSIRCSSSSSSNTRLRPLSGVSCSRRQRQAQTAQLWPQQLPALCRATINSEAAANQEWALQLSPAGPDELEQDRQWISAMVCTYLDEEWTPLEVHQQLGEAAGAAYVACRQRGDDDMSSLVLGMANELLAFNYRDTFVNAFEVSNKVVEQLMVRSGIDVCCTADKRGSDGCSSSSGTEP